MVARPDLSNRVGLSKSLLTAFDLCNAKAWNSKWHRRPFIPNPKVAFGNAVDAGVETLVTYHRMGQEPDMSRAFESGLEAGSKDGIDIDYAEVNGALEDWEAKVAPYFVFTHAITQHHFHLPLEDWGEADGHPDLILPADEDNIYDVKTAGRRKETARTLELGFYALAREAETGRPVREVGYMTRVRLVKPFWQVVTTFVDDAFRNWTRARVSAFVRADRLDDLVQARRAAHDLAPQNQTMPGGPKNNGLCFGCEYSPKLGGNCELAVLEPLPGGDE